MNRLNMTTTTAQVVNRKTVVTHQTVSRFFLQYDDENREYLNSIVVDRLHSMVFEVIIIPSYYQRQKE